MKFRRHDFTLFELLISIALLVVLSVVLLRIFVLTGDFWSAGEEQARLYADAKTALSVISEDLENIVYQNINPADSTAVTAPLWLEGVQYPNPDQILPCYKSYTYQSDFGDAGYYGVFLHLITRTKWGLVGYNNTGDSGNDIPFDKRAQSDICEVSYLFWPPKQTGNWVYDTYEWNNTSRAWKSKAQEFSGDGELARSCTDDTVFDSGYPSWGYNFTERQASDNIKDILGNTNKSYCSESDRGTGTIQTLLKGVLDFRVYAYKKPPEFSNEADRADYYKTGVKPYNLLHVSGSDIEVTGYDGDENLTRISGESQDTKLGATDVTTIQIVLTVMPPKRIDELRHIANPDDQRAYIYKYARTFRKTVRIKDKLGKD